MRISSREIILGIDPGLSNTGFGIIAIDSNRSLSMVGYGCITTKKNTDFAKRLGDIVKHVENIIQKHSPTRAAIESLFFYKNVSSALNVGQANGAVIATCNRFQIPIQEYTPLEIKQSITGYGKADKNQVQQMVKIILRLSSIPKPNHAADALAVAICCAHSKNFQKNYEKP